jgi:hypothetical protein
MAVKTGISKSNIDAVIANLNREIQGIAGRTQGGLTAAGLFVRAEAQKRCPVDVGNLKNSAYTVTPGGRTLAGGVTFTGAQAEPLIASHKAAIETAARTGLSVGKSEMYAEIGFTAFYAVYVHEIDKNYTVGGWKYLERAIHENKAKILQTIRDRARVKK